MSFADRVFTVPEAAAIVRISVRSYYQAASRGEVPVRRIGRRLVVPGAALERYLAGQDTSAMAADPNTIQDAS